MSFTTRAEANKFYAAFLASEEAKGPSAVMAAMAELGIKDLFFLLTTILHREDVNRDWLFDRCQEVQANPDGYLDLWAREHYKSTIITFGLTIQDILKDPEETIGIFSHTRPIAKGFLRQIKAEFEGNELLKKLYPAVLYQDPKKESPKWSEDDGIVVKRKGNPKECTIEAYGLVDGQPTSKHYGKLIYDDVVTRESVNTPDMIQKTTAAWELSLNLGTATGKRRYVGTRYHYNDTYQTMIRRGAAIPRLYPGTDNGQPDGKPVLISQARKDELYREMGSYTFACQILQDPKADQAQGFKEEWLEHWAATHYDRLNIYILVDPAGEKKKKTNDYSVFKVIGLGPDQNYYEIEIVRDRLNLTERTNILFQLHEAYSPLGVGYEKIGMQSDIEHIKSEMDRRNYRFTITEIYSNVPKNDRIRKLIPLFQNSRYYLPERCHRVDYQGVKRDLVQVFINDEYLAFPVSAHDDMLDCSAMILSEKLGAVFPKSTKKEKKSSWRDRLKARSRAAGTTHMSN